MIIEALLILNGCLVCCFVSLDHPPEVISVVTHCREVSIIEKVLILIKLNDRHLHGLSLLYATLRSYKQVILDLKYNLTDYSSHGLKSFLSSFKLGFVIS